MIFLDSKSILVSSLIGTRYRIRVLSKHFYTFWNGFSSLMSGRFSPGHSPRTGSDWSGIHSLTLKSGRSPFTSLHLQNGLQL
jgi:hypothetical protein